MIKATIRNVSTKTLMESYERLGSVWRVADELGLQGQSVHKRLAAINAVKPMRVLTRQEKKRIQETYKSGVVRGDGKLDALASELGRTKHYICRHARAMGLTDNNVSMTKELSAKIGKATSENWARGNHPKGMKGKKHTEATKFAISMSSRSRWHTMSSSMQSDITKRSLKTRMVNMKGKAPPNRNASWKAGWREVGGKRFYARSAWEANYARILQLKKDGGEIYDWEHEPDVFWFEAIKRGVRSYKPDFKVWESADSDPYYVEVKGWMDAASKTKLKRMKKYHPGVRLELVDSKAYKRIAKTASKTVPGWE